MRRDLFPCVGLLAIAGFLVAAAPAFAQSLRLLAPPDGTVVEPGQSLTVIVEPAPGRSFQFADILIPDVTMDLKEQPPFVFTVSIPPDAPLGPHRLHVGARDDQDRLQEQIITIHIETTMAVMGLEIQPSDLFFASSHERALYVTGTFMDGQRRDVTRSRETTYASSHPMVAAVTGTGFVEALDSGTATITVTYKTKNVGVPVTVAFTPEGRLPFLCAHLQGIAESNRGTALADKVEDAHAKCETGFGELSKSPPDEQAAVGNLEGAVADLQAAVQTGLLDPTQGGKFMDRLARTARQLAMAAVEQAAAQGGDPVMLAAAQQAVAEGNALREKGAFSKAINKYKDALAKARSARGA